MTLYTSNTLPSCKILMDDWKLIKISGSDSDKFLQGQLTADIHQLKAEKFIFSAHCDPKGKVWSNLLLFKRYDDIYYIVRKSVYQQQLQELKKFAVFSKVTIEEDNLTMLGIAGNDTLHLNELFSAFDEQNCVTHGQITCLKLTFPTERYIIIGMADDIAALGLPDTLLQQDSEQWKLLDMEANYPIIDKPNMNLYLPQAFNLDHFEAINFNKGCYCGQEMVTRAQYRGINKRGLYLLSGHSTILPEIGEALEQSLGENWRETGTVLAAVRCGEHEILVQAILSNEIEDSTSFRVKNAPNSHLVCIKK